MSFDDLIVADVKDGDALIGHLGSCAAKPKELSPVGARVSEPSNDAVTFGDQFLYVIVKIGKCAADSADIPFKLVNAFDRCADRAAENDVRRNQLFEGIGNTLVQKLRVVPAYKQLVVRHAFSLGASPF